MIAIATSHAATSLELEVVTRRAELADLAPCWNELVAATGAPNPFLTWEWIGTWLDLIARDDALRVLVVRDRGEVVGIAPFVVSARPDDGPALWRELVFAGSTVAAPDHLDVIARDGWSTAVARRVADWIEHPTSDRDWDVVRLDGFRPRAPLVQRLTATAAPARTASWQVPCPYVPLPSTWEEYAKGLKKNFRRNLRRRLRKLERETPGPVEFDTVEGGPRLEAAYADLVRLHEAARHRNGESGAFDSPKRRAFYDELVRRFAERGWLRIDRLRADGDVLAAALTFRFGGKLWCYQMGYDLDAGQYGPGYLIAERVLRAAIDEGASELDLLRGDHPYKYEFNAETRSVVKLRLGSSLAGRVVAPATRWLRAARGSWKEWRRAH